jgi:hypothetical protein
VNKDVRMPVNNNLQTPLIITALNQQMVARDIKLIVLTISANTFSKFYCAISLLTPLIKASPAPHNTYFTAVHKRHRNSLPFSVPVACDSLFAYNRIVCVQRASPNGRHHDLQPVHRQSRVGLTTHSKLPTFAVGQTYGETNDVR